MTFASLRRAHWICILYCVSGCAGLIYETVWIRAFALSFGNTLLSFSTVISVFLGGLAAGATLGGRLQTRRPLLFYGAAELWIAGYALAVPWLMDLSPRLLGPLYGSTGEGAAQVAIVRIILCTLILLPATVPMGAGLPWLLSAIASDDHAQVMAARPGGSCAPEGRREPRLILVYVMNTLGGAAGAILSGLVLLPELGYRHTLITASLLDGATGLLAIWLARAVTIPAAPVPQIPRTAPSGEAVPLPLRTLAVVTFFSGWTAMLYEVADARVAGLLFGPTAATVTLTLAAVLVGLAAGGILATAVRRFAIGWLAASQFATAAVLLCGSYAIAVSPAWLAGQIRARSGNAAQMELLEAALIFLLLCPLMMAAGMALPLAMSHLQNRARDAGRSLGGLYGMNTAGCVAGALLTGWLLVPHLGAERTLYAGALVNTATGIWLIPRFRWRAAGSALALLIFGALIFPRWDMAAITSGVYKYAPYYSGAAADEMHNGEMEFLREGPTGTVTVRRIGGSQVLAIDGKVDATDAGGDLLTEKLLAHIPLSLIANPRDVCVIGLASGVTAGAALTYPVERLDVLEVSGEVVQASRFFDGVNGKPLDSTRTRLIVNDGRNHLELTAQRYDAILSEPSNPWIAGMNAMFTRDFFRIARSRLKPGGVLAQWFHLYNMPPDDLRSLLRAFTDVFPSATLWQLNEGDVLLTGLATPTLEAAPRRPPGRLTAAARADLARAGVGDPDLLPMLYIMRGSDLVSFAATAKPNTDDWPVLEFHGQGDMDLQTSERNIKDLAGFPRQVSPPEEVVQVRAHPTPERLIASGQMFEKAESYRLAFESYREALAERPQDPAALAGMLRCARSPEELDASGTLATRTTEALTDARNGNLAAADSLLRAVKQAWPQLPEPYLNYGLFCLETSRYDDAIESFNNAIHADPRYLPAFEAMAKTYLRLGDLTKAALWSRRILDIDPGHATARQVLAELERRGVTANR